MTASKPTLQGKALRLRMLEILRNHPQGISANDLRRECALPTEDQMHFNRRIRNIRETHELKTVRRGGRYFYVLGSERRERLAHPVPGRLRALVLHEARGRCGMCGRTIEVHGIALEVDHRVPGSWGGKAVHENLWAICAQCNRDKKALFASIEETSVALALDHGSVHVRLGEVLKSSRDWVPGWVLSVVANRHDWMKRIRDLRYLGWQVAVRRRKLPSGKAESQYKVVKSAPWSTDPSGDVSKYERARRERNRRKT